MTPTDFAQEVLDWGTGPSFPIQDDTLLHHLFEKSAQQFPDNVALICGSEKMTYAELDKKANCLAKFLVDLLVTRDRADHLHVIKNSHTFSHILRRIVMHIHDHHVACTGGMRCIINM